VDYRPSYFPVQVEVGKEYHPGFRGHSTTNLCRYSWEPWWSPDTFRQVRASGAQHNAIDVMSGVGARVVAARAGRVGTRWVYQGEVRSGVGQSENGGNYVRIEADDGGFDYYAHMRDPALVQAGQHVAAGQLIGFVGKTGNAASSCPHLHYQVGDENRRAIDPIPALTALYNAGSYIYRPTGLDKAMPYLPWVGAGVAVLGGGALIWWWTSRRSR